MSRGISYLLGFSLKRSWCSRCWYTNSTLTANNCDEFYTDPNAIMLYKQYAKTIITRVNTITNVSYANDPTIMAYDLMNEPRCELPTCTADNIQVI